MAPLLDEDEDMKEVWHIVHQSQYDGRQPFKKTTITQYIVVNLMKYHQCTFNRYQFGTYKISKTNAENLFTIYMLMQWLKFRNPKNVHTFVTRQSPPSLHSSEFNVSYS